MNINMLRDQDDNAGFWTAVANSDPNASFAGATLYVSPDGTTPYTKTYSVSTDPNYTQAANFTVEATIGYATNALGDFHGGNVPDELNALNVKLYDGSLSSTTYAGLLAGTNAVIVGEEIIYFRDATLQTDGSYTLTGLLRGRRGSEYAMSLHAVNDRVMFVDLTKFVRIPQVNADIGQPKLFKAVPALSSIGAVGPYSFTNEGAPLKPYSPVHLGGGKEANGDWTLNWVRRTRIDGAWRDYVEVPLGESVEAYTVEIYTDDTFTTLKRTISATSQTATYTAAQQTSDFGSGQSEVYFVVYQLSAALGPGYAAYGHVVSSGVATPVTAPPPPTPAPPPEPGPAPAPPPSGAPIPFAMGVNIHEGGTSTAENTAIVAILESRGITAVRMDLWEFPANQTLVTDMITKLVAAGISIQGILMTDAQNDHTIYTGGALTTWEAANNASADAIVDRYFPMGVSDYELLNEVTLRSECVAQVAFNSGQLESAYTGQTAFISIGAALKGMADAVHAKHASCRVILGTVGRDWGFLRYMDTLGVNYDVVGWHNYPSESTASMLSDTYYGTGGPLAQLDAFGLPITINEFHSGEIFLGGYDNTPTDTETEAGFQGLTNHLQDLYTQTVTTRLESVLIYELLDEPAKSAPENHFGLMYDLDTPKVSLYIVAAFAGGDLSTAERAEITTRSLLTDGEIDDMQPPTSGYDGGPIAVYDLPTTFLQTATGPDGEAYWINDGVWGAGPTLSRGTYTGLTGTQYEQYIGVSPDLGPNGEVACRLVWKWPYGTTEVKSYPGIIYGNKPGFANSWTTPGGNQILLPDGTYSTVYPSGPTPGSLMPRQLPLAPWYSTFNYTHLTPPTGKGHLAYDIWLQNTSTQYQGFGAGITHEIMIPVNNWGGYGDWNLRNPSWNTGLTVTMQGILFHVFYAPDFNGVWKFIVFQPDDFADITPGMTLNLAPFVNYVAAQGWATGNEWMVEPEFGVEPEYGTGDLVIHGYREFA